MRMDVQKDPVGTREAKHARFSQPSARPRGASPLVLVAGVVVALASQCIWGRVNMHVYDTGRDLMNRGVIPLDDMFPETALVKLMWVLGQTNDSEEAKKLLKLNIAGEFSPRTLPEETGVDGGERVGN